MKAQKKRQKELKHRELSFPFRLSLPALEETQQMRKGQEEEETNETNSVGEAERVGI